MKIAPLAFCALLLCANAFAFDNVLLISIDTLRADHLSCYGSKEVKTPNIDALAGNGVLFKDVVSPAPFTLPAHVSMLTGLIPPMHGVADNGGYYLDKNVTTLAEVFHDNGMSTGAFVGAFPLDSRFGLDQGFDVYDDNYPTVNNVNEMTMPERDSPEVTAVALKWLQTKVSSRWFAFVHYYDAHFPYKGSYGQEIERVDQQIGVLMKFLKDHSLQDKTLVVITADHGESLGEHQEQTHGIFAYESTLRIPLIFSPFKPKVVESRVRLIDVAPTIAALQQTPLSRIQGVSLVKWIEGGSQVSPDSYFESLSMYLNAGWAPLRGFYSGNMKFIDLPIPELYDISKDPKETKNLCSDQQLCNLWRTKFQNFFRPFSQKVAKPAALDRETAEQLKALGYLSGGTTPPDEKKYTEKDDPKTLIVYHNRMDNALTFYNKGLDLKALDILEKIIEERPDYSVAYEHASYIRSALGFPDQAADVLKKAIENGVSNEVILGKLGLYLYESDHYDEAITQLNLAIKEDPRDIDNIIYLGMCYTAQEKYSEAENAFRKALALDPSSSMTLNNLGTLYLTQKKYDPAKQQFQAAIAVNPHSAGAYNGLGVIYASQKNWPLATQNWELALKENGKDYDAMLNLAYAYLENSQNDKALTLFQQFAKEAPRIQYAEDLAKVQAIIRKLQ